MEASGTWDLTLLSVAYQRVGVCVQEETTKGHYSDSQDAETGTELAVSDGTAQHWQKRIIARNLI